VAEQRRRHGPDLHEVGRLRVAVARALRLHERSADDDARDVVLADLVDDRGEIREALDRDVGPDRPPDRIEQVRQLEQQAATTTRPRPKRDQDLLLAGLSGEVALTESLA